MQRISQTENNPIYKQVSQKAQKGMVPADQHHNRKSYTQMAPGLLQHPREGWTNTAAFHLESVGSTEHQTLTSFRVYRAKQNSGNLTK